MSAELFSFPHVESPSTLLEQHRLYVRPLQEEDFSKGFCEVLGQLTSVGEISRAEFSKQFKKMQAQHSSFVIVIEDLARNKIVGAGTLAVEEKFIHNCGSVGHIEDIVVDSSTRGKGLGLTIIHSLVNIGDKLGCYKILLDCSDKNVAFYERCGFKKKEIQMVKYLPHNEKQLPSKL